MVLKNLNPGQKFQELMDLEDGETWDMVPTYQVCILDKSAFNNIRGREYVPVMDIKSFGITIKHRDTEVIMIP